MVKITAKDISVIIGKSLVWSREMMKKERVSMKDKEQVVQFIKRHAKRPRQISLRDKLLSRKTS